MYRVLDTYITDLSNLFDDIIVRNLTPIKDILLILKSELFESKEKETVEKWAHTKEYAYTIVLNELVHC